MTKENKNPITVLDGRVKLRQAENGFRTSIDAVLLAAACPAKDSNTILDLGCGVGSAGLCALARLENASLTGIDIQADHIDIAAQNAALNAKEAQCRFICTDIRTFRESEMDHVICNPPFLEAGTHLTSPSESRAAALGHPDEETTLEDWITCTLHNLKHGGSFTMIHRADHIDKIIQALGNRFGATEIIPLWPKEGIPAKRVIIRTIKNRKSPATLHPGLVLHDEKGDYTDEAQAILRDGKALFC